MTKVYLVWDDTSSNSELYGIYGSEAAARDAVVTLLEEANYSNEEWQEFARDNGFDKISEFKEALRHYPDYDDDMLVQVEEHEVLN